MSCDDLVDRACCDSVCPFSVMHPRFIRCGTMFRFPREISLKTIENTKCLPSHPPSTQDEGISITSSLVYNGQPVGGCYLPTNTSIDHEVVFAPNGEFEGHIGTLAVILSLVEASAGT